MKTSMSVRRHAMTMLRSIACAATLCCVCFAATGARAQSSIATLDIDGDGTIGALTDGLLVLRYTFGMRGSALIEHAIGAGAVRTTAVDIENYLARLYSPLSTDPVPADCSISASPVSSADAPLPAGTVVTLTALCQSGALPITYAWSLGVIGPTLKVAPSRPFQYTVSPSNSAGLGIPVSIVVYSGGASLAAPSNCSVLQYPDTALVPAAYGKPLYLAVFCSEGSPPTTCTWSNGISSNACNVSISAPPQDTDIFVTPANGGGTSAQISTHISVPFAGGFPTNILCTGSDEILSAYWPLTGNGQRQSSGFKDQRISFKLTVPTSIAAPDKTHLGTLRIASAAGAADALREVTVSNTACDFATGAYRFSSIGSASISQAIRFTANNPAGYAAAGADMNLTFGDTVYINVRNQSNGVPTCSAQSCDVTFEVTPPQ